jgi:predicted dehydrogenase
MNNERTGIGIVGCGYWGANYVRVFNELQEARVTAICDKSADRLCAFQRQLPGLFVTTDVQELLTCRDVDAVVVCTEAVGHYTLALKALNEGKDVLIEKPMTTEVADAEALTRLADAKRRTLMVGHTFIYNPAVRKLKECVGGRPEQIYYMHACRTNLGPIRQDVNAIWDLAAHDIAIFNYLMEASPRWVSAVASSVLRTDRADIGFISLGYGDNVLAHIHVSWADPNKAREVTVVCSDKRIVFNDLNATERVRIFEQGISQVRSQALTYGEYTLQVRDGDIISPKIDTSEPLKNQCRHFLDCIRTGERPLSSGSEGVAVIRVLKAADRSVALHGSRIDVEPSPSASTAVANAA